MALDPSDYIDSFIIKEGYYESEVFDALASRLQSSNDVVWDVGANIGIHSLTMAKLNPGLTVVCFEPNPCLVEVLRWQMRLIVCRGSRSLLLLYRIEKRPLVCIYTQVMLG